MMKRIALFVGEFGENRTRQTPAARFRALGRFAGPVLDEYGLGFLPAQRRRPVGKVRAVGLAGPHMQGSEISPARRAVARVLHRPVSGAAILAKKPLSAG